MAMLGAVPKCMALWCVVWNCHVGVILQGVAATEGNAIVDGDSFLVAEVKPHYQCSGDAGPDRVRKYVQQLVDAKYDVITLLQLEFAMDLPRGYVPIGGVCGGQSMMDSAGAFIRDDMFRVVRRLGDTFVGRGSSAGIPWLHAQNTSSVGIGGHMCVAVPSDVVGVRAYAGLELEHLGSGLHICLVVSTFPHPEHQHVLYNRSFIEQVAACSRDQPLLVVADTNLADEDLNALFHGFDWRDCSDPARLAAPTCCNDSAWGHPEPRFRSDRTFMCGGGSVTEFEVEPSYICHSSEEHRFTRAKVSLPAVASTGDSAFRLRIQHISETSVVCALLVAMCCCWLYRRKHPSAAARELLLATDGC